MSRRRLAELQYVPRVVRRRLDRYLMVPSTGSDQVNWISDTRRRLVLPAIALSSSAGYYLGSVVGLQLRVPPATTSVMWPPNAVLTAALVLTSPRRWPLVLLSALPVHVFLQIRTGFPLPLIFALFVTNCFEALIAAGGLYLLSDAPRRFDTLRRLVVFLAVAVIAAPLLSTFADAAVVTWLRGEPYWQVWQTRLFSNVLAELTVVPAIVGSVPECPAMVAHDNTGPPDRSGGSRSRIVRDRVAGFQLLPRADPFAARGVE